MRGSYDKLKTSTTAVAAVLLAVVLTCGTARAEMIRELVTIHGAPPVRIQGTGLVIGLANTGDKKLAAPTMLHKYLGNTGFDLDPSLIATNNIALVHVTAEIPPFSRPGQAIPVLVSSIGDAKSLKGGKLLDCNLFVRSDPGRIMATATGPLMVGDDMLTQGKIAAGMNSGAQLAAVYEFGNVVNRDGILRLNLNRPSWIDAYAIARQINQTPSLNPNLQETSMFAEAAPTEPVAYAKDMGQVMVRIPEQYRTDVAQYVKNIMEVPVAVSRPATILVNRAKNSIVVTGDVRVNNALVSLQDKNVTIRPETEEEPARYTLENDTARTLVELEGPGTYADLQGMVDTLNAMGLTTNEVIIMFEQLLASGAIHAELIYE